MVTEKLFGQSMLMDADTRVILRGEIALMSDGKGRSEIHVRNDETGMVEKLVFTTGTLWIPVLQLIQAIRDTHEIHDIGVAVEACTECVHGEYEDEHGNWKPCPACMGVP